VKTVIYSWDKQTREFFAGLRTHREDPDQREVVGQVQAEFRGRQFVRNIREGEAVDIERLQQEVQALERESEMKP